MARAPPSVVSCAHSPGRHRIPPKTASTWRTPGVHCLARSMPAEPRNPRMPRRSRYLASNATWEPANRRRTALALAGRLISPASLPRSAPIAPRAPSARRVEAGAAGQDSTREDGPATAQADTGTIPCRVPAVASPAPGAGRTATSASPPADREARRALSRAFARAAAKAPARARRPDPGTPGREGRSHVAGVPAKPCPAPGKPRNRRPGVRNVAWRGSARRIIPLVPFRAPHTGGRAGVRLRPVRLRGAGRSGRW